VEPVPRRLREQALEVALHLLDRLARAQPPAPGQAVDVLLAQGKLVHLPARRVDTPHTHGTGCVLSASITARLAKGQSVEEAVRGAKDFVHRAIATNPGLGKGHGPVNLFTPC